MAGIATNPTLLADPRARGQSSKQPRHSAKQRRQGAFVKLNVAICSASEAGSEALLQLVYNRQAEMNLVNFSTALHRLARLAEEGNAGHTPSLSDPRYASLLESTRASLVSNDAHGKARCLSTIGWAVARLGLDHLEMMQEIAEMALPRICEFKPYELGILLWSYAKLQITQTQLFEVANDHISEHMDDFSAASLATLVWSFATARLACSMNLIRKAADAFAVRLSPESQSSEQEKVLPVALENMMWGLATMRMQPNRQSLSVIADAALGVLQEFKTHEFTIILWAFARLGFFPERLFSQASCLILSSSVLRNKMHPQGIANLFWAYSKYAEKSSTSNFISIVTSLLPTCQKLLPQLKPQELGCVLSSLSAIGKTWHEDAILDDIFVTAAWIGNPVSNEWSLASVVKVLKAYSRFMGNQGAMVEPCASFVMKMICLCPRFEDKFDAQSLPSIIESLPLVWTPSPEVTQALSIIILAGLRTNGISRRCLDRVAALAKNICADNAAYNQILAIQDQFLIEESEPLPLETQITGGQEEGYLSMYAQQYGLSSQMHDEELVFTQAVTHCPAPAYSAFTSQSWLRPELWNFAKEADFYGNDSFDYDKFQYQEVAFVNVPTFEAKPARLAVLEDFTFNEVVGNATSIMFEVDSDTVHITCDLKIHCYANEQLYETLNFCIDAGATIPNTHVLNLTRLEEGQHDIYFALSTLPSNVQHEKFTFWVTHKQPISSPVSKRSATFVSSPLVDVKLLTNCMMQAGLFNSRSSSGGSTRIGCASESSDIQGVTSEEE